MVSYALGLPQSTEPLDQLDGFGVVVAVSLYEGTKQLLDWKLFLSPVQKLASDNSLVSPQVELLIGEASLNVLILIGLCCQVFIKVL